MPLGTLEVLLVDAKGLDNNDFLADMDPYVLLTLRTQEKKSNVVSGQGSAPEWNETFVFTVSDDVSELHLKIMEKDNFSADDFVGEATISLEPIFTEGSIPPTAYNVVNQDKEYRGEIKVGLRFTPEREQNDGASGEYGRNDRPSGEYGRNDGPSGEYGGSEEGYGGWKQSSYTEE
ncbi:elicitor-responsive protein 3-like [Prunus avium]|uniref:Elicitor-responsive protein 3-like n=1 Tax=Prunus avium TaxID=42229 RepID=A0A6P5SJC7_PRUAV|nr:elicitor-responsive protein 3-like [Prunus avium]